MNTVQLIEQSQRVFTNLEKVEDKLYRGKLSIEDKIAGIYYLNFNQEVSKKDFEELQYRHLAEEFYKQEEDLQWNIYLLFINNDISDDLKVQILTDDKYARKLIFTDNEFIEYFKPEKWQPSDLPDIVSNWKQELNSVELQELYSSTTYESVVRNFINNTIPEVVEKTVKSLEHVPIIEKISSISLHDNYRPFPTKREFHFGTVNLFTGSNGVGKTSLLESIELVLTGRTQRNFDKREAENSINAILNNNIDDSYKHNNNFYKDRGVKWYNRRSTEQGNQTCKSFNQFNFFNTDAAHQFSNSDEIDKINESLKQIILGEEYTALKDKIEKVEKRLRPELKRNSDEIERRNDSFKQNQKRIEELKTDKNFKGLKDDIKRNISNLGYNIPILESNYSTSNLYINEIKNEIDFILSNEWVTNYNRFREIKENIEKRKALISSNKENFEKNNHNIIRLNRELKKLENRLFKFNTFMKYLNIENISSVQTLESNLSKIEVQLSIINILKELNSLELDITKLKEDNRTIPEIISTKEILILNKKESLKDLQSEIKKINENFSVIEKLSSQIKFLGREILNHKMHSDNCPLCEQQISHSQLLLKLESDFNSHFDKSVLNDKNRDALELDAEISLLEKELKSLKHYQSIVSNYLKDYLNLNISEIDKRLIVIISEENEILREKEKLEKISFQISNIEGSIKEYLSLNIELSKDFPEKNIKNKLTLDLLISDLNKQIETNFNGIKELERNNDNIIIELNTSLKLKDYADSFEKIEIIVNSNETKIESLNFSFENLKRYLNISGEKGFLEVSKELNLLNGNLNTFRFIENNQNEIKKLLTENEEIEKSLPKLKVLNSRINNAVKVLSKLNANSEDSILDDFFNENLNEIKDIFKTIHSPQEFTNLEYKDNMLVLFKGDSIHQISEISTGQRAALVLSIFISLNRKLKNGPNILIFDDPVTFIDDFNALSFLDFLRYFIVKEKKQIFFATANKKFSTLFKKKFDFLGKDEFKEFYLER